MNPRKMTPFLSKLFNSKTFSYEEKLVLGMFMEEEVLIRTNPYLARCLNATNQTAGSIAESLELTSYKVRKVISKLVADGWLLSKPLSEMKCRESLLTEMFYQEIKLTIYE